MLGHLLGLSGRDIKHAACIISASREDFVTLLISQSDDGPSEMRLVTRLVPANIQNGSLVGVQCFALRLPVRTYLVYTNLTPACQGWIFEKRGLAYH